MSKKITPKTLNATMLNVCIARVNAIGATYKHRRREVIQLANTAEEEEAALKEVLAQLAKELCREAQHFLLMSRH